MKRILYLLTALQLVSNVYAWGPEGHKIVAQIAEDQLSTTAKRQISSILGGHGLAEVSTWADAIKSKPEWEHTKTWHFVNIRDDENYEDSDHDPHGDVVTAITEMVEVLKTPSSTDEEKQNAVKFIVHFVGDIHQPLHAGRPDDRGGNSVQVTFNGKNMNLHSLWDSAMINVQKMDYVKYARYLQGLSFLSPNYDIPEFPFSVVIKEGMDSRKEIYNFKPISQGPIKLEQSYLNRNLETMNTRLLKGGQRLANLFNSIYK